MPIPKNKSDVDAFLDDIFSRALNTSESDVHMYTHKIQNKIKGKSSGCVVPVCASDYEKIKLEKFYSNNSQFLAAKRAESNSRIIEKKNVDTSLAPRKYKYEITFANNIKGGSQKIDPISPNGQSNYYTSFYNDLKTAQTSNYTTIQTNVELKGKANNELVETSVITNNENYIVDQITSPTSIMLKQLKLSINDIQARAKTVRIGKVRWPPPIKESELFENEIQRLIFSVKIRAVNITLLFIY